MEQPPAVSPTPAIPAPQPAQGKSTLCKRLEEQNIKVTVNLGFVSFQIPLLCKTIYIVAGLIVAGALILILPRLTTGRCAYAGVSAGDEAAIAWLINAEGEAVVKEDLALIEQIFAPDALIVDMLTGEKWFSPVERYTHLINAADYSKASHADIKAVTPIAGGRAYFTSSSRGAYTVEGVSKSYSTLPDSDHWTLEKRRGCWIITQFEFNAAGVSFP